MPIPALQTPALLTLLTSAVVAAAFTFLDRRRGPPLLFKMRGSRWLKWFLPTLIFAPGVALILNSSTLPSLGIDTTLGYIQQSFAGLWIGWIPLFAYAGLSRARTRKKLGWVIKVWLRSLPVALILVVVAVLTDLALAFSYAGQSSGQAVPPYVTGMFLVFFVFGISAVAAFFSFFPADLLSFVLLLTSLATAFGVTAALRRWKLGNVEPPDPPRNQPATAGQPATFPCPSCGSPVQPGQKFCNSCGRQLEQRTCPKCGQPLTPDEKFCGSCGTKVAKLD